MTAPDTLPGAECFYRYLCSLLPGQRVHIMPPVVLDWSYGMEFTKAYEILADDQPIGTYCTRGPKPGEQNFERSYDGGIPGYVNDLIVNGNRYRRSQEQLPENQVILIYSSQRFEALHMHHPDAPGRIVETPWQRQDGHDTIPFP